MQRLWLSTFDTTFASFSCSCSLSYSYCLLFLSVLTLIYFDQQFRRVLLYSVFLLFWLVCCCVIKIVDVLTLLLLLTWSDLTWSDLVLSHLMTSLKLVLAVLILINYQTKFDASITSIFRSPQATENLISRAWKHASYDMTQEVYDLEEVIIDFYKMVARIKDVLSKKNVQAPRFGSEKR